MLVMRSGLPYRSDRLHPCPARRAGLDAVTRAGQSMTRRRALGNSPAVRRLGVRLGNRVVRSTSVPIADRFSPMIGSPSQWLEHRPVRGLRFLADVIFSPIVAIAVCRCTAPGMAECPE